jgi:lysosomal Pro-X carboxypeptidase
LAPRFGAAVIEIEHRFYGPYRPIMDREATIDELLVLLTPQQAMADMVRLTKHFKDELDCSQYTRQSENYCPVISVGGSYPGFLSAMFRLVYPDFVDISYASSAPLKLYDQSADQYSYYDIVTQAAERTSEGCAHAVRETLEGASKAILKSPSMDEALKSLNMCVDEVPDYINDLASLNENLMLSVTYSFANYDMDAYPPGKDLVMYKACQVFQKKGASSVEKLEKFFKFDSTDYQSEADDGSCFDLSAALSGSGNDDKMWDFQLCTTQINPIGTSNSSMFIPREWTLASLVEYCQLTFGVTPRPHALADALGFDDLVASGATRILFTNGMQDMWSGGSYLQNVTDSILALNFENGAHHSDLSHVGPSDGDTDDIKQGYVQITDILAKWLDEIRAESMRG